MESRGLDVVREKLGVVGLQKRPGLRCQLPAHPARPDGRRRRGGRLSPSCGSELRLERCDADEAFGRLMWECLTRRIRRQRLGVERLLRTTARRRSAAAGWSNSRTSPSTMSCVVSTKASIARRAGLNHSWRDAGGALRVGPESAGANPGPACYGRGGTRPTVTDANLVLGRAAGHACRRARSRPARRQRRRWTTSTRPTSSRSSTRRCFARCGSSQSSAATTQLSSRWSPTAAPGRSTRAPWQRS